MNITIEYKKQKALELMKTLDIYKPYSVLDYQVFEDERGHYIEYGNTYEKIYIDETEACK